MTMTKDELKRAVAEAAVTVGMKPGNSAYAQLITELLQPRHITLDVFGAFMPVVRRNPGDYLARRFRKGKFRARTMVPGAQHLTDAVLYNNQFTYFFDRLIAGAGMNMMEVQRGELGTLEEIKSEVAKDLIDNVTAKAFNLLTSVWNTTNTPLNYVDASSTGLTATALDYMLENIIEKAGNASVIMGTRRALLPLYAFAGYTEVASTGSNTNGILHIDEVILERFRTGSVSTYRGVKVMEMPQVLENRLPTLNTKLIRDDVVLILGESPGEIVLFGEPGTQEHIDTTKQPADYQYWNWQEYGFMVDRPEYVGVIKTR